MPRGRAASEPRLRLVRNEGWQEAIWYICWHDGRRQRKRSTGTGSRGQADKIFARWLLDYENEQRGLAAGRRDPTEAKITDILAIYAEQHGPEVRYRDRIADSIKRLAPWWKGRVVDAVSPISCQAYRDARLKQGVKIATIRRELGCLRAALIWAHRNKYLKSAPYVKVPPAEPGKDRWLTRSEAARLLWAARQEPKSRLHLPLFILIALYTGARSEAILTLKWFPQVDFDHGVINFNPPGRARTKKGRAIIPIPPPLRPFLERAKARATSAYVLNRDGVPIKRIKHSFTNACKRAGFDDVTPHTLRHTCGTWLAQQGVDLWQIAGWLGHSDTRTTEIYAHHHPDHLGKARAAFDRRTRNILRTAI